MFAFSLRRAIVTVCETSTLFLPFREASPQHQIGGVDVAPPQDVVGLCSFAVMVGVADSIKNVNRWADDLQSSVVPSSDLQVSSRRRVPDSYSATDHQQWLQDLDSLLSTKLGEEPMGVQHE